MSSTADIAPSWTMHPVVPGDARAHRQHVVQLGLWGFLGTVTMLFAAFTSAMLVRRSGGDWVPTVLPSILWLNTACLGGSSLALEVGRFMGKRARWSAARLGVGIAILLGLAFLVGQFQAWQDLVAAGIYVPTNPHSSFFYILTGVHAVHLFVGLLVLLYTLAWTREDTGRSRIAPTGIMTLGATFWHFFGALWIYLFYALSVL